MGTLGVDLGTVESFKDTADLTAAEGVNSIGITPFYFSFRENQVLVVKLVYLLIHNNTDINFQMLVVPRDHLCKVPAKSFFYAITCLIIFAARFSHRVTSLPLTLFRMFTFTHLSSALNKGMI